MAEDLLKRIEELEEQNKKLKERLRKRNNHSVIKTKKKDIVKYWTLLQDECGLSLIGLKLMKDVGDVDIKHHYKDAI